MDERKRLRTIAKHGFDFLQADELFDGPRVIVPSKRSEPEERFLAIGKVAGSGRRSSTRSAPASIASSR